MTSWTQCPCFNNIKKDFSKPLILRNVKSLSMFFFPATATSEMCSSFFIGQSGRLFLLSTYSPVRPREALSLKAGLVSAAQGDLEQALAACPERSRRMRPGSREVHSMNREIPHFSEWRMVVQRWSTPLSSCVSNRKIDRSEVT